MGKIKVTETKETKKEKKMKKQINWTVIKSVVGTLVTLAIIGGLIFAGWELRGNYETSIDKTVTAKVTNVQSLVKE